MAAINSVETVPCINNPRLIARQRQQAINVNINCFDYSNYSIQDRRVIQSTYQNQTQIQLHRNTTGSGLSCRHRAMRVGKTHTRKPSFTPAARANGECRLCDVLGRII